MRNDALRQNRQGSRPVIKRIKTACIALLLACAALLCGCWNQRELKDLNITIGVGIDKDTSGSGVMLTAQIVNPEMINSGGGKEGGGGGKSYINHKSTGSNTFEAIREMTHEISERLYEAHTQVFVIGSDVAKEGVRPYLDFFIRAVETRPTTKIVIAQGMALDVLNVETVMEKIPAMQINKLVESQELNSHSKPSTIQQYISAMVSKTYSFTAPILRIEDTEEEDKLMIKGMAVFKQDRMIGELGEDESRGFLWVDGKTKSGSINVQVDEGKAAIEIKSSSSKVSTRFDGDMPAVEVSIEMQGSMATQTCKRNLATNEGIAELESLTEQKIMDEISMAVAKARELNADIFGFGEDFHKYHSSVWKQMEPRWDELFPDLIVDLKVKVSITAAGVIVKPAQPGDGEQ